MKMTTVTYADGTQRREPLAAALANAARIESLDGHWVRRSHLGRWLRVDVFSDADGLLFGFNAPGSARPRPEYRS